MTEIKEDVTYLGEVIQKIISRVNDAGTVCRSKVLPGPRAKVMIPLQEANTLLKSVAKVLEESGMDKKLGFVPVADGIKPVIASAPVKESNDS